MKKNKILFDALVFIVICSICITYTNKTFQNDIFYTIPIGKNILRYGVDMIDHFSIHNISYVYPHWLFDTCTYLLYCLGGFRLLYISSIILYIIICSLLYFLINNLYKNRVVAAFLSIATCLSIYDFITARAQIVTFILFILEAFFIEKFLSTSNKKYLISFPIISILILNMHCAVWPFFFILFLPSIAEYLICIYKKKKEKKKSHKLEYTFFSNKIECEFNNNVKYLMIVCVICLFTGFITLNGTTPYTYLIKTLLGATTNFISEHQPTVLVDSTNLIFYLCFYVFILMFLKQKIKLRDIFLSLGLFILAFSSTRHISLLVILSAFPLARILSNYFKNNEKLTDILIVVFTNKFLFGLITIVAVILSLTGFWENDNQKYIDEDIYPIKAADYILDNLDTKNIRLYNEYDYGSYLLFRGIPVFVDSRADLYTPQFNGLKRSIIDDMNDVTFNHEEIFNYYDITHVIVYKHNIKYKNSILYEILHLDNNYNIIYEDKYFALFEKLNMELN